MDSFTDYLNIPKQLEARPVASRQWGILALGASLAIAANTTPIADIPILRMGMVGFGGIFSPILSLSLERRAKIERERGLMNYECTLDLHDAALQAYRSQFNPDVALLPPTDPQSVELFDWNLFNSKSDKYPHLFICGGTGDGKSTLATALSHQLGGIAIVAHPHWEPGDFEGMRVMAIDRNYGNKKDEPVPFDALLNCSPQESAAISYTALIKSLCSEMDIRYARRSKGDKKYPFVNVILDEFNSAADVNPELLDDLKLLIREARKVSIRLILLIQDDSAKGLKLEGQTTLRKCFRYVRLGEFATNHAKSLDDPAIMAFLATQEYPMIVEDIPAISPPINGGKNQSYPRALPPSQGQSLAPASTHPQGQPAINPRDIIAEYLQGCLELPPAEPKPEPLNRNLNRTVQPEPLGSKGGSGFGSGSGNTQEPRKMGGKGDAEPPEPAEPDDENLRAKIAEFRKMGMNQTQIIFAVWGAKKGASKAYQDAVAEYKRLSEGE